MVHHCMAWVFGVQTFEVVEVAFDNSSLQKNEIRNSSNGKY
jgi:hypothetical protein